ncbi:MAG TPA: LuxR C-terminal-related transcriptional regulator [Pseudonocardiaceae bacterium]|nr:LuxR C-terminal-related transcriptional regulator [Actinoplanes sp.]
MSNAEIAARLYVTAETVRTHVTNVRGKLGAPEPYAGDHRRLRGRLRPGRRG